MKRNIANVEIVIRLLAGIALADLAVDQASLGHWNMPLFALAFFFALTAIWGWCPLYALLHVHTNTRHHQHHPHQ
ncbi:MAG TPA: DUF2892 domain-containing protein [Puia sp.]|uniref:YgaP family membrane protein n=1 Tax=Puia sp. TaxID=2045100 RepID=UPI002BC1D1D1|nr:DUF2892 domain-containing protein [Puia sp.]HVU94177.1 DUF2892 domain-containing protein [Puia sp.]